ncbi:hypothetical protein [Halopiger xanaduensis]|uniref:Metallo-beta-lactamase domain-containing protein n=1 Tax=Halopiger xanaduensis (strain DSM 18323 / JCM 14033 / SH-6) TaxID=797210 RepID=F8D8B6_HALXS|nr:hypothetical protein [Halopiger xanaduensis]AEH36871.1 hypothetical protein Halxa_2246 [Halopiger xanaduensis SH-6]
MGTYDRSPSTGYRLVDEFDGGFGWFAHPDEAGLRASHAIVGTGETGTAASDATSDADGDVWLFDPLEAPGIDDEIESLGDVAGVVVCSDYHARDAGAFARRFDVPVYVPAWLERVPERVDAPLEFVDGELGTSGFALRESRPMPGWREAIAHRRADATLYVPDLLGTAPPYITGDERLAVYLLCRLRPPTAAFEGIAPERILLGHGFGVFDDAAAVLADALGTARRGFPRALVTNGPTQLRALLDAL